MPKPTVAILHYSCPPVIGGVEFIIKAHALEFVKAGYPTRFIVGKGGAVHTDIETVVIPEIASRGGPLSSVLKTLAQGTVPASFDKAVKQTERKLLTALRGVDVCMMHNVLTMHFNLVLTTALANIMKRRRSTRFIAWTHDLTFADPVYESHQHRRFPWSQLFTKLPGCDYCAISGQRQQEIARLFPVKRRHVPVIPDGISVPHQLDLNDKIARLFEAEYLSEIDIVALTPARIMRRKNLGLGMEIVSAIKKQGRSIKWILTGAPDAHNPDSIKYYHMLCALRRRLKLTKDVIFLCDRFSDGVSGADLLGLFRLSDLLLMTSDREGFGLPVLEAGLAGMLIAISDIPALRELAGRDAVLIRMGDSAEAIAKKIISGMRKRPELIYRKQVMSTYSWDVVFEQRILPAIRKPDTVWKR